MLNIELSLKLLFWRSCPVNFFLYVKLLFPLYICLYLASFSIFVLLRWIYAEIFSLNAINKQKGTTSAPF